jgi:hypothetical protein
VEQHVGGDPSAPQKDRTIYVAEAEHTNLRIANRVAKCVHPTEIYPCLIYNRILRGLGPRLEGYPIAQREASGHDSAIEASFFINEDALRRIQPDARPDESGFLNAFDSNRDLICAAAAKLYVRGSRGSYDLVAANF